MAVNKVVYSGRTLIDLSSDTVTPESMVAGTRAHDKTGTVIYGTLELPSKIDDSYIEYDILEDSNGNPILDSSSGEIETRLIYRLV